jgi:hypothetical protein
MKLRDEMAAAFRARPGAWIHWDRLIAIGGRGGWRTRVSECRTQLGMNVLPPKVKRLKTATGRKYTVVFYRYVPSTLDI